MDPVLIIIAFNLFIFFRTLRFSICVDDIRQYKRVQDGLYDEKLTFRGIASRLYGGGTFGRAKAGEAPDAHVDHAFTIFLHTLASVLIYLAFGQSSISFWAAILYSCNPTNTQTSVWLNGRRYLVNVIIVLTIVILSGIKYGWLACLPLYTMTGLFHVTAIFGPILFLGWFSLPAFGVFYLFFRKHINEKIARRFKDIQSKDWREFKAKRLIVIVKCYGFFIQKMLLPGTTLMNYPTLFMWGVTKEGNDDAYAYNFDFYRGIIAFLITVVCYIALPSNFRPMAIFATLAILQWCAIIPATQLLADRYTSTAMPFVMFFVAYFVQSPIVLAILTGFYTAKLWYAMEMFTDIWHYYKYQLYHAPYITTPRKDLINYLIHVGDHMKAWHYTREGLEFAPKDFSMLHRAAIAARACGSTKQAMEYLMKAEANPYLDQEESQKQWCDEFRAQMKKMDLAQLNNKRMGG